MQNKKNGKMCFLSLKKATRKVGEGDGGDLWGKGHLSFSL